MLHIENTWVQKRVVPNLNVQIIYMDGPYLPKGEDQIILENEKSDSSNDKELTYTQAPYIISKDGLIILGCLDPNARIYCFFDYSIRPIEYSESEEFTNLFNSASKVLAYAYGLLGVSKTVKLK
jgi:hypothetical protein